MDNYSKGDIERLQSNLSLIRSAGGWTMEDIAEMLDVSKQTVSNLESGATKMSRVQYIAIRSILDYKVSEDPDNKLLVSTINLCLNTDDIKDEDINKVKAFVSGSQKSKLDATTIVKGMAALVGISLIAFEKMFLPTATPKPSTWLNKVMKSIK